MSFNLLYGYMGQISFGHAAFFGLGAYATAMLFALLQDRPAARSAYLEFFFCRCSPARRWPRSAR